MAAPNLIHPAIECSERHIKVSKETLRDFDCSIKIASEQLHHDVER